MDIQTWKTTLIIKTDEQTIQDLREWFAERDADNPQPRRNDDLLAKYLRNVLTSNNDWDGVSLGIDVRRPHPLRLPWQRGYEPDPPSPEAVRAGRDAARRRQFAVDCFALLVLLIVGATAFAAYHSRTPETAALPSSYIARDGSTPVHRTSLALGGQIP
ncbi:hypothetical protein BRADO6384 [Bradyrhizobium sp. ORS 278]|uniref:hypothetical protein n=1 Tax=Bradyrhizobium sp. (strain ORS 278) TaxID=114615 RepID=UPI00015084E1|nr:hypothetical protein [Bradyrhizobium sp. ORS 278]CAL80016.1 hypothetical protein BRADO6384 [Bradyrhizobium sp. ORS 278]